MSTLRSPIKRRNDVATAPLLSRGYHSCDEVACDYDEEEAETSSSKSACSLPGARELTLDSTSASSKRSPHRKQSQFSNFSEVKSHYSVTAVGRRFKATKMRHLWTLTNSEEAESGTMMMSTRPVQVELKHSRVSGRKQIFVDGHCMYETKAGTFTWTSKHAGLDVRLVLSSEQGRHSLSCEDVVRSPVPPSPRDSEHSLSSAASLPLPLDTHPRDSLLPVDAITPKVRRSLTELSSSRFGDAASASNTRDTVPDCHHVGHNKDFLPGLCERIRSETEDSITVSGKKPNALASTKIDTRSSAGYQQTQTVCGSCVEKDTLITSLKHQIAELQYLLSASTKRNSELAERLAAMEQAADDAGLQETTKLAGLSDKSSDSDSDSAFPGLQKQPAAASASPDVKKQGDMPLEELEDEELDCTNVIAVVTKEPPDDGPTSAPKSPAEAPKSPAEAKECRSPGWDWIGDDELDCTQQVGGGQQQRTSPYLQTPEDGGGPRRDAFSFGDTAAFRDVLKEGTATSPESGKGADGADTVQSDEKPPPFLFSGRCFFGSALS
eukprot:TRINITY_DN120883_c0_g1_i1.p1 TRINITY_DN120883_c0_g1~~TRINITY_DN120883_c0_g1_i1.p1  ORF type:complete len:552 (+),score=97.31 TRINITY_DN120883_c0_g1_i1:56-1711(+)